MSPDVRRARCTRCGATREEAGGISWTGLCRKCGLERCAANYDAMQTMRGPFAQWWAVRIAASAGYGPLDDLPPKP